MKKLVIKLLNRYHYLTDSDLISDEVAMDMIRATLKDNANIAWWGWARDDEMLDLSLDDRVAGIVENSLKGFKYAYEFFKIFENFTTPVIKSVGENCKDMRFVAGMGRFDEVYISEGSLLIAAIVHDVEVSPIKRGPVYSYSGLGGVYRIRWGIDRLFYGRVKRAVFNRDLRQEWRYANM